MNRNLRWIVFGVSFPLVLGCASHPGKSPPSASAQRWNVLDNQINQQEAEIYRLTQTISSLQEQLAVKKGHATKAAPNVLPLTKLSPEVADADMADDDADDKTADVDDLPARPEQMSEANVIADSRHEAMPQYYRGMYLFQSHKYDAAAREFTHFLESYPDHVYADRAQYWLTECHFENHDYGLVVYTSNQLEARYPYSLRLPDAMQKRALAMIEMGQPDQAALTLRDLLRRFPDSSVAEDASRLLATVAEPRETADGFAHDLSPKL